MLKIIRSTREGRVGVHGDDTSRSIGQGLWRTNERNMCLVPYVRILGCQQGQLGNITDACISSIETCLTAGQPRVACTKVKGMMMQFVSSFKTQGLGRS